MRINKDDELVRAFDQRQVFNLSELKVAPIAAGVPLICPVAGFSGQTGRQGARGDSPIGMLTGQAQGLLALLTSLFLARQAATFRKVGCGQAWF
jgi:hypothetical protein